MSNSKQIISSRLNLPSKLLAGTALAALIFLIAGTFLDQNISASLFRENTLYELIFYCYGPLPSFWGVNIFGYCLFELQSPSKWKEIAMKALALVAWLFGIYYIGKHSAEMINPAMLSWILAILLTMLPSLLIWKVMRRNRSARELLLPSLFLFLTAVVQILLVTALKEIIQRPRYRILQSDGSLVYQDWYRPLYQLLPEGVDSDQFRSFPSGHTSSASCILAFSCLIADRKKRTMAWIAGLCWIILVAGSRMVAGAHFLSDVSAGLLICLLALWLSGKAVERFQKDQRFQSL